MYPLSPDSKKKFTGMMRFFGKLRSQSTTFNPEDMSKPEFKKWRDRGN